MRRAQDRVDNRRKILIQFFGKLEIYVIYGDNTCIKF